MSSTSLIFDSDGYEVKTYTAGGRTVRCRAWLGLSYCESPRDPIQKMNLFAPLSMFEDIDAPYTASDSPIFLPNTVGGYMPGPADEPGIDEHSHTPNSLFCALEHGFVAASAGVRGRTSGMESKEFFEGAKAEKRPGEEVKKKTGRLVGRAPAFIVDMKAAIRYLRHNRGRIPGDPERIVTNGTSAGGALSALTGTSGNAAEYAPFLREIGAADERDDIFAASVYCPIHNLEHADMAYEWFFHKEHTFHMARFEMTADGVRMIPVTGELTEKQMKVSDDLRKLFPHYVRSLNLKDEDGQPLTLDDDGKGSLREYMKKQVIVSAQKELDTHDSEVRLAGLRVPGSEVEKQDYLTIRDGKVTDIDWDGYVKAINRMKPVPAFDSLDLKSPENEEFGTEEIFARHFTDYSQEHSEVAAEKAPAELVRIMNPVSFIGNEGCAKHFRIRHGAYDRDTASVIPAILAILLENAGVDVDFFLPWGLPHSGDYDLEEVFTWIDELCAG